MPNAKMKEQLGKGGPKLLTPWMASQDQELALGLAARSPDRRFPSERDCRADPKALQRALANNQSSLSARRRNSSGTERPTRDADP
jgi:hypothetical protein